MRTVLVAYAALFVCVEAHAQQELRRVNAMLEARQRQRAITPQPLPDRLIKTALQRRQPVAQRTLHDLSGLGNGEYLVTVVNGAVTIERVTIVKPGPTTPPPPPPPVPTLQKISRDAAAAVNDPVTAQSLASGYGTVINSAASYQTSLEIGQAFRDATDQAIATPSQRAAWQPFRERIGAELTRMAQEGRLATVAQYVQAFTEIRSGLTSAQVF